MKAIRRILRDRISATAIAVLAAYFLLLQGLLGGMAQGAMAASAVDPLHVICSSSGAATIDQPGDQNGPAGKAADCPCCTLCRLACAAMPAILDGAGGFVHLAALFDTAVPPHAEIGSTPPLRRLIAEPRAPPSFS
ncbi:DUF2946 family protein [Mesorhizobium sp. RMAD-H1]|uniref:DUF2946 family protein n=1 Tax=Mesorhizobium sp. RMAD-H1 TaxID=2587065 RepID=UPI00161FF474|nr:DUF2946 family protein [Mesorhizobium sp. RMAD-H1]MBB2970571.1 hypothetical protein [Mesorhizobium sp. RMAD-H1]